MASAPRLGLMGHVIADYPTAADARALIAAMAAAGVAIIEIQMPFSEPMADGPLFLAANHAALKRGVGYAQSMALMREASQAHPEVRFVFMSYLNPVFRRGYGRFVAEAAAAGAAGVIIPDLPLEEAGPLEAAAAAAGSFFNVRLIAPNASDERLGTLTAGARGLIYAVARAGVTGAASDLAGVRDFVGRIKARTSCPVAVGFGVRSAADVVQLRGAADYAVIGTAALKAFQEGGIRAVGAFWSDLVTAATN